MNKTEMVAAAATELKISKAQAESCLNEFIKLAEEALKNDEKINILGFGAFTVSVRKARTGINPRTKEKMVLPETKTVKFSAGKNLKELINK